MPYFDTSWTVFCVVTCNVFSRIAAWWCWCGLCMPARAGIILSLSECLPWLQLTHSLCQSKSQWFGTWAQAVDWQLWFLRALLTLRASLLLLSDTTKAVVLCRIPGNPKFCLGSQCRWRAQALHTEQLLLGAPSAGREMGFGWASADPACRFNLGQSELKSLITTCLLHRVRWDK